ncbi:hypothetical protein Glove_441g65 [Diversispora epigaea]|uniref:Uncharacterized protein n=1 Tax=Diversispora epigaea TaxID=1348612 RepID=A0A397GVL5_9GLOM|nr:hypothetical protein Glove_441g65 [Diversispora epigaea]
MALRHRSSFNSFYKKNNFEISSITSSIEKDSLFFGSCITISPDCQQIATFDPVDNLSSGRIFNLDCEVYERHLCWFIAMSNCIDDENERLIALSCGYARGFQKNNQYGDNENDLEIGDIVNDQYGDDKSCTKSCNKYLRPRTWVISTKDESEIHTSLESIGVVIRFFDSNDGDSNYGDDSDQLLKNKPTIIIVNASGIYKETISHTKRKQAFFSRPSRIKQFELPKQLSIRLAHDHWQNSYTSIVKNYFVVHSFKNRQQIIEMDDPTVILKYLIDYYANNAKKYNNHGWMFTVSKAIPLLYDHNLRKFIQYLFKKPCFGTTEAYTPLLHINKFDQKKGNNAAVIHPLIVKPRLAPKFHYTLWVFLENLFKKFRTSRENRKVYMVPLPDFTVYPNPKDSYPNLKDPVPKDLEDNSENYSKYFWFLFALFRIFLWSRRKVITNTREMSPFLRVIHEEKGNPRYIYYIPDPNVIDTWLTETRSVEKQKLRLMDNSSYLQKYRPITIHNEGFSNTINLNSIRPRSIDRILLGIGTGSL